MSKPKFEKHQSNKELQMGASSMTKWVIYEQKSQFFWSNAIKEYQKVYIYIYFSSFIGPLLAQIYNFNLIS